MNGFLVLESGECYSGQWHGGVPRAGEVVFNTSHSGYEEIATDPSYLSQIVVMTASQQGNYGVSNEFWESKKFWIEGFVCLQIQNSEDDHSWVERLNQNSIPSLDGVDTRLIVSRLRKSGTTWGALVYAAGVTEAKSQAKSLILEKKKMDKDWVHLACTKSVETRKGQKPAGPKVHILDFGCKENIVRELSSRCREVKIFPSRTGAEQLMQGQPDFVMLTNGPGDPADVLEAADTVKSLLGKVPVFGICMGHQILGIALGAKTYKLKFGHRGANHPIQDTLLNKIYISSQNHGYAIDPKTLPADVQVTQINLNDQTVAGIFSAQKKCLGIQFHPESHPGPHEGAELFDFFIKQFISGDKK